VLRLSGATVFIAGTAGGLVAGIPGAIFALPIVAAVAALRRPDATRSAKGRARRRT
jgi:predicted PurR-regulated permease PerM